MMGIKQQSDQRRGEGYFVPRPLPTDALGESLRSAFGETHRLPEELARSLAALDHVTQRH